VFQETLTLLNFNDSDPLETSQVQRGVPTQRDGHFDKRAPELPAQLCHVGLPGRHIGCFSPAQVLAEFAAGRFHPFPACGGIE